MDQGERPYQDSTEGLPTPTAVCRETGENYQVDIIDRYNIYLSIISLYNVDRYRHFTFFRFIIKEKALSMSDLDDIWAAQAGKHEVMVQSSNQ